MSKQYRILGVIISLGIGLAVVPIKLTGDDVQSGGLFLAVRTIRYTFTAGILAFFLHLWLNRKFALFLNKWLYLAYLSKIILVAIVIFLASISLDFLFLSFVKNSSLTIPEEDLNWYLLISRCILISAVQFFIVFYLQLLKESQQRNLEIEKLKQAQLEANLSNLKEQMSPHFLFNTLNTLSAITQDKQVKEYVSEIATVYRYMLVHNKLNLVPLANELSFIKSYLYILKTRMGASIIINIHVEENLMQTKMPPLTLQLLLENAIKHNVASVNNPLRIEVYNDPVYLVIRNSFIPKKAPYYSTGVGLNNLMNRYQLLFRQNIVIEKNSTLFTVKLPIINS
ncbi:histidine kinase [Olivibacter sp. CPCC 100613]|uniref:sensor histidine kinase n=1 Tax=Olivibacter sp. CPCC 100613 TaxID=3079931 RepID=UPI002FF8435F